MTETAGDRWWWHPRIPGLVDGDIMPASMWERTGIRAFVELVGGSAQEILLLSSWGIGILARSGNTLTSPVIQPNGTRFGGWLFDSRANQIAGIGDVDGDGRDEIVIISDWGIGVLSAVNNTFTTNMLAPNGTRFGGWLYQSRQNNIHALGDFDGDGRKEILITSDWGIGVLKLSGNSLTSIAMHANGSNLNGYTVDTKKSRIAAVGNLAGGGSASHYHFRWEWTACAEIGFQCTQTGCFLG